jgi:hypothetical protein
MQAGFGKAISPSEAWQALAGLAGISIDERL